MQTALQKAKEAYQNASPEARAIYDALFGKDKFVIKTNRPQTFEAAFPIFKKLKFKDKDWLILQRRAVKDLTSSERIQICAEVWRNILQWKADYDDENQKKWFPWFTKQTNSGFVFSHTLCEGRHSGTSGGARLALPTSEIAAEFGKTFLPEFNNFLIIKY